MQQETTINERPEITYANTAKIIIGDAITDLSFDENQPHNIFNGAFRAVYFLGRNRIESQSLILDTVKKVQGYDFNTPTASVTERFHPSYNDTFVSEQSSEFCTERLAGVHWLLKKIGIPDHIIIESSLQSCIDYGTSISADSGILMSLLLNAASHSFEYSHYD